MARGGRTAAEGVDVERLATLVKVAKGVEEERQPSPSSGRTPSTEERRMCETGSMYGTPSKNTGQRRRGIPDESIVPVFFFFTLFFNQSERLNQSEQSLHPREGKPRTELLNSQHAIQRGSVGRRSRDPSTAGGAAGGQRPDERAGRWRKNSSVAAW